MSLRRYVGIILRELRWGADWMRPLGTFTLVLMALVFGSYGALLIYGNLVDHAKHFNLRVLFVGTVCLYAGVSAAWAIAIKMGWASGAHDVRNGGTEREDVPADANQNPRPVPRRVLLTADEVGNMNLVALYIGLGVTFLILVLVVTNSMPWLTWHSLGQWWVRDRVGYWWGAIAGTALVLERILFGYKVFDERWYERKFDPESPFLYLSDRRSDLWRLPLTVIRIILGIFIAATGVAFLIMVVTGYVFILKGFSR